MTDVVSVYGLDTLTISCMTWTLIYGYITCSVTRSWIQSISCKAWTLLEHSMCTSISKTCAECISKAGALLVHVEFTSLGNSWELPSLLLCTRTIMAKPS